MLYFAIVAAVAIILFVAFRTIQANRPLRRYTVTRRAGGLPFLSTCCAAATRPLGWTQDGWVAACRQCGEWQYLGEDHKNPPPGFNIDGTPNSEYERLIQQGYRESALARLHRVGQERRDFRFDAYDSAHPSERLTDPSLLPEVTSKHHIHEWTELWEIGKAEPKDIRCRVCGERKPDYADEGDLLDMPPQPNMGGEGNPEYKGPHYDSLHEPAVRFIQYELRGDPIPGTAVIPAGSFSVVGPIEGERDAPRYQERDE